MILKSGKEWTPSEEDVIQWQRSYARVDVHRELAAMDEWLYANPKRRKTQTGIKRFVNGWLNRADQTGGQSPFTKQPNQSSIRDRSLAMSLTDISWLDEADKESMRKYYLNKCGYYWDNGWHGNYPGR